MKYSKLLLFGLLFSFGIFKCGAQTNTTKSNPGKAETFIKSVKPIALNVSDLKSFVTYRKLDLINSEVNSRIKCSFDLFDILNDKETC